MSELSEPIWVISWSNGRWPLGYGITYAEAEKARETAINERPGVDFTIVTFEAESEVVREITAIANAAEQAERIRTAAEALVAALTQESDDYDGLVYYEYAKELADLQMALSRGWLSRRPEKRR